MVNPERSSRFHTASGFRVQVDFRIKNYIESIHFAKSFLDTDAKLALKRLSPLVAQSVAQWAHGHKQSDGDKLNIHMKPSFGHQFRCVTGFG